MDIIFIPSLFLENNIRNKLKTGNKFAKEKMLLTLFIAQSYICLEAIIHG